MCLAEIQWRTPEEPYVRCEDGMAWGEIPLNRSDVHLWQTSFSHVAQATAGWLGLTAPREEVIPERLWWIGGMMLERKDLDIYLARGADWEDAPALFQTQGRLTESEAPVILVPHAVPAVSPFPVTAPVRSLTSLLHGDVDHLRLRSEQLTGTARRAGKKRKQQLIPIPTPPGTDWSHVFIEFANDEYVQIHVGTQRYTRSFAGMGFADLRIPAPTPSELWSHLRILAKFHGRIAWDTPGAVRDKDRGHVSKWMSAIRHRLQAVFPGIAGDPFYPYKKVRAFQVKCGLRWAGSDDDSRMASHQ
jgi:hypothetical protein